MEKPIYQIYIFQGFPEYVVNYLLSQLPSNFTITAHLEESDFVLGGIGDIARISTSGAQLHKLTNVKLIQSISAGYDSVDIEALSKLKILFATNDGANSIAVAEHTILMILALYKQLIRHHTALRKRQYLIYPVTERFELARKTVGVIGLGRIGRDVVKRLKAFDVNIVYYDIYRDDVAERELGVDYLPLDMLLTTADVITIHVPLTSETKNMIGTRELSLMKPTALLINTARGEIIDERALYYALKEKQIAGAGIDTWANEKLIRQKKQKSLLWDLDNVVMTPHIAGPTYDTFFRRIDNALNNFIRVTNGEIARSVIVRMQCPKCEMIWDALSHRDYERLCPKCKVQAYRLYLDHDVKDMSPD